MKLPGCDPILPEQSLPHVSKLKPVSFLQDRANKLRKKNTSFMTSKVKYGSLRLADFVVRLMNSTLDLLKWGNGVFVGGGGWGGSKM